MKMLKMLTYNGNLSKRLLTPWHLDQPSISTWSNLR